MLPSGRHKLGPDTATLQIRTAREGAIASAGHDLVIDATRWEGTLAVAGDTVLLELTVDARALDVRWGLNGSAGLTDKDRSAISATIDSKVLRGAAISFRSRTATPYGNSVMISGDLTIGSATRTISFELRPNGDGTRVDAIARLTQSDFAIKPYSAMLGALKVRDVVEVVARATLPLWSPPVVWRDGELGESQGAAKERAPAESVAAPAPAYAFAMAAARPMVPAAVAPPMAPTTVAPPMVPVAVAPPMAPAVVAPGTTATEVAPAVAADVTPQTPAYVPPWSAGGLRRRWPR